MLYYDVILVCYMVYVIVYYVEYNILYVVIGCWVVAAKLKLQTQQQDGF